MTFQYLKFLLDYHYWARDRLFEALAALSDDQFTKALPDTSIRDAVAHMCDAECIWLKRWQGERPNGFQKPDRIPNLSRAREEWISLERGMYQMLQVLGPQAAEYALEYTDFAGTPRRQPIWQLLHHIVNHGTHHRGQVTTLLRQLAASPPKHMDMIIYFQQSPAVSSANI